MTREEKKAAGREAAREARARLRAMSNDIAPLVKVGVYDTINEGIMEIYDPEGVKNFNTFWEWKAQGRRVKKGEKGWPIWGRPVERGGPEQASEAPPEGEQGEESEPFWPVCYLFEESQTEPDPNPQPLKQPVKQS